MHFASSVLSLVAVVAQVAWAQINFNCPNLADGAIVRFHPCWNNQLSLSVCSAGACGTDPNAVSQATLRQLQGADLAFGEWRIITTGLPADVPAGHIRLRSEAPGMTSVFLSVESKDQTFANNQFGRQSMVASYVDDPKMSIWRWDLRPDNRQCRVLLRNLHASRKLGLIRTGGPQTTNNIMRPVAIFQDGTSLTDETWEIEYVRMGAAPAPAPVAVAAAAPAPAPAPVPAPATDYAKGDQIVAASADDEELTI